MSFAGFAIGSGQSLQLRSAEGDQLYLNLPSGFEISLVDSPIQIGIFRKET